MDTQDLISTNITKLKHPIEEIRARAFENITNKLQWKLVTFDTLLQHENLLPNLLTFLKNSSCETQQKTGLSLLSQLINADEGVYCRLKPEDRFEIIQRLPEVDHQRLVTNRLTEAQSINTIHDLHDCVYGEHGHLSNLDESIKSDSKICAFPEHHLSCADIKALEAVNDLLQLREDYHCFIHIVLYDFPASVFLQHSRICEELLSQLYEGVNSEIVITCLSKLVSKLHSVGRLLSEPYLSSNCSREKEIDLTTLSDSTSLHEKCEWTTDVFCMSLLQRLLKHITVTCGAFPLSMSAIQLLNHSSVVQDRVELLRKISWYLQIALDEGNLINSVKFMHLLMSLLDKIPNSKSSHLITDDITQTIGKFMIQPVIYSIYPSLQEKLLNCYHDVIPGKAIKLLSDIKMIKNSLNSAIRFIKIAQNTASLSNKEVIQLACDGVQAISLLQFSLQKKFVQSLINHCFDK